MEARALKDKAAQLFTKGRFAKAAETYEEFCALDKKDHQARLRCGDAWAKAGKKDKAIGAYSLAAEGYAKDGFLPRAIAASKLVLEIDPSHKGVQKMLADLYAQKSGGPRPGPAAKAGAPAPEMEISRNVAAPTSSFANRKSIDLETPAAAAPANPAPPPKPKAEAPSPMNRADAIELPEYEIPLGDGSSGVGGMSAAKGPSPQRNEDAIEIDDSPAAREGPAALVETSIEIDLASQPTTGEVEVPIEGQPLPDVEQLPPELQMSSPLAPAASPSAPVFELAVEVAPVPAARPPAASSSSNVYELTDAVPETPVPQPSAPVYELTEEAPAPPPAPRPAVYELTDEAPAEPAAPVYELSVEALAPQPSAPVYDLTDVDEPAPVPLPAPEAAAPIVARTPPAPSVTVDLTPTLDSLSPGGGEGRGEGATLDPLPIEAAPPGIKPVASSSSDAASAPPGIKPVSAPTSDAAAAPPGLRAALPPAVGDAASAPPGIKPVSALPPAVGDAASAPPGIKPVSSPSSDLKPVAAEVAPPGLKPKKGDVPAPASSPSSSRIWLPPSFTPATPREGAPVASASEPSTPRPPPEPTTDLERSLQAFMQFDPDAPVPAAAPVPEAAPPEAPRASFTELDLDEGDSLLHTVDAAARTAQPAAAAPEEEAMEAPEEARPEAGGLPKIPLFSDLPEAAFIALFEQCPLQRFEPGQLIFEQGDKADAFYVICGGSVRVFRSDAGQRRDLATLEEGSFFGEMALLSEAPRSASVEAAAEDTQVLVISAEVLTELSSAHPVVATALKKFCRQRMLSNLMNSAALFSPFNRSDRRELVQKFRARDVKRGDVVVKEGATSDGLYVVLSGEVEVEAKGQRIATLKEGQVFGEMSLLLRSPASATVRAARHTSLLRLPKQDFDSLILSHPQVLEHVSTLIDERKRSDAAREKNAAEGML